MSEYIISNPDSLERLYKCFGDTEDFFVFLEDMHCLSKAVDGVFQGLKDHKGSETGQAIVVGAFLIECALFFRRNIDTLNDMVSVADLEVVDEAGREKYMSNGKTLDLNKRLKNIKENG